MGRQVNFYMTAEDEQDFVSFVRSDKNAEFLNYISRSPQMQVLEQLPTSDEIFWAGQFLWNREFSPLPSMKFIEQQGYYIPDSHESEIIEFSRSHLDEGRLNQGRIWAEMNGWQRQDPATIIKKSEPFSKWFDRLANWIKRRSTRDSVGFYVLPGAAAFVQQGGYLR